MNNNYRINVRFDLRKETEKEAADYLIKLSENSSHTRNRFIVDAVIEAIRRKQNKNDFSLDDIRAMFREELQSVSFEKSQTTTDSNVNPKLTEKEKEENEASIPPRVLFSKYNSFRYAVVAE